MSKAFPEQVLNNTPDAITNTVAKAEKAALVGFGTFSLSGRVAHDGRNPKKGKTTQIPAGKVVKFLASKICKCHTFFIFYVIFTTAFQINSHNILS